MSTFTKSTARKFAAVILFFSISLTLFAQKKNQATKTLPSTASRPSQHPDFEPLFTVQVKDPVNCTADEVFEMALLFSECERESDNWKACWEKFEEIKMAMASDKITGLEEEERGRAILKFIYRDYLKSYSLNQTKVDVAINTGVYNCVSSAILYMVAAKAAGLDVRGQRTTQHAFCSVYIPDAKNKLKKIDVETTNPYGFNPGSKEEIENESKIKQYYVVPKKYYSNRAEVSDCVFAGLIAENLCSAYIKTSDYRKALPLGAARWEAVKNEPEKGTAFVRNEFDILAAKYVNLLPESAAAYSSTLEWFEAFIKRWGNNDFLQKNLDNSFINLLVLCNKEGNYELALSSFEKYNSKISLSQIAKSEEIITDLIIVSVTSGLSLEEKIEETKELLASEELAGANRQKRGQLHLESFWVERLNALMNEGDYEEGYRIASEALTQIPKSSTIKTMQNHFYNNSIAVIHNNFARAANAGDYAKAQEILKAGLVKFPNDKALKKDLLDLQKVYN